ncbi:hypothetical protein MUG91_G4582n1, partial [Manis pentadactyla]
MTDIEADGVGSDTLALWKDLGSGSDMTGSARWWIRLGRGTGDISGQDTLALWKDLGSGSDMMGSARWWIRVMIRLWREFLFNSDGNGSRLSFMFTVRMTDIEADGVGSDTLALWKDLGSGSDMGWECKMVDQGYGEARVMPVVKVKCEILTKGLGLALVGNGQIELHVYGQIDLDHHGVALVTSMLTLRIQLKGSCLGVGYSLSEGKFEIVVQDYGEACLMPVVTLKGQVTSMLMLSVQLRDLDIEADGVGSDTLALWKDLGSGSDMTGVQDGGSGL